MTRAAPEVVSVRPEPDAAVLEAIQAAVSLAWPEPPATERDLAPPWRFSGRWWAQPAALRRDRPSFTA
ncbi:MAG: hypothetical protein ACLP6E_06580 [Acidimicrobiales bacterium]